jgi:hypothetical protein
MMRMLSMLLCFLLLPLAPLAQASATDEEAVRETLASYLEARRQFQWEQVYALPARESRAGRTLEAFVEEHRKLEHSVGRVFNERTTSELEQVTVDGNRAHVAVKSRIPSLHGTLGTGGIDPGLLRESPLREVRSGMELVREDRAWRVIAPEPKAAPPASQSAKQLEQAVKQSAEEARRAKQAPENGSDTPQR